MTLGVAACVAFILVSIFVGSDVVVEKRSSLSLLRIISKFLVHHRGIFIIAGTVIFCLSILRAERQLLIPIWGNTIGLNASEICLTTAFTAGFDMMMFPLAGYIMDNWVRKCSGVLCMVTISLAVILVPWTSDLFQLCMVAILFGIGNGLGSGINVVLGSDFSPSNERVEFLGVWRLVEDTDSFIGPIFTGSMTKIASLIFAFPLVASFGLIGILLLIFLVREPLSERVDIRD